MADFIRIQIINMDKVLSDLNIKSQRSRQADSNIMREVATVMDSTAKSKAHIITGKTKGSIQTSSTGTEARISASYGAAPEEKRGSNPSRYHSDRHDFITLAAEAVNTQAPGIITKHYDQIMK